METATRPPDFRFYFFTSKYNETVAFYHDVLQLKIYRSWDRSDQERGTVFFSPNGVGLIEVEQGERLPQIDGGFYIEVEDIEGWHERMQSAGVPIRKSLGVTDYGHLNFKALDPSGVEVTFFQYVTES